MRISGGFAGCGAPDGNVRDIDKYKTILSGDLGGDDAEVGDPRGLPAEPTRADNSFHVVTVDATAGAVVLSGITIVGGNANAGFPDSLGGAIWNIDCVDDPILSHCTFRGNSANRGGAIFISCSTPGIGNCHFNNNSADGYGGAVFSEDCSSSVATECSFKDNNAERGGAVYNSGDSFAFFKCIFMRNWAEYAGAVSSEGSVTLTNCLFTENRSSVWGGALSNFMSSSTAINCTFANNTAKHGGAIFSNIECDTTVTNSILWNNHAETGRQICTSGSHGGSTLTVDHCDITGGRDGIHVPDGCTLVWAEGNINAEPFFVAVGDGDFHLRAISPCINAGDGSSWKNAFVDLQSALGIAREPDEIRVARGIYRPAASGGDRDAAFEIPDGVSVIGGFAGVGKREPDIRDIGLYETILSGDLNGDDVGGLDNPSRSDNAYHVVKISRGSWRHVGAVLDGLTITGGQSDRLYDNGGGIYTSNANGIVIRNCRITKNYARSNGGGGVDFTHCIIWGNTDSSGDGQRAQIGEPGEHTRFTTAASPAGRERMSARTISTSIRCLSTPPKGKCI